MQYTHISDFKCIHEPDKLLDEKKSAFENDKFSWVPIKGYVFLQTKHSIRQRVELDEILLFAPCSCWI